MRTRLSLKPSQPGTKSLLARYGERLVCVRYRYDAESGKRFKTAELIVAEADWRPANTRLTENAIVSVRVRWDETELRRRVKLAGGRWDPVGRVWRLRHGDRPRGPNRRRIYIDVDGHKTIYIYTVAYRFRWHYLHVHSWKTSIILLAASQESNHEYA